MVVAIHQPTFFPWLGYFNKILRSDRFIILDDVQFIKKGSDWTNRVYLLANGQKLFVTVPVDRSFHGTRLVSEIEIDRKNSQWVRKFLGLLQTGYSKCPHFDEIFPWVERKVSPLPVKLFDLNHGVITDLVTRLGLSPGKLVLSSSLKHSGTSTERLVSLVKAVGGTTYLCGDGAQGYQQDELFEQAGLKVEYQKFRHPEYHQTGQKIFTPGLSIIDCLMNLGFEGSGKLVISDK